MESDSYDEIDLIENYLSAESKNELRRLGVNVRDKYKCEFCEYGKNNDFSNIERLRDVYKRIKTHKALCGNHLFLCEYLDLKSSLVDKKRVKHKTVSMDNFCPSTYKFGKNSTSILKHLVKKDEPEKIKRKKPKKKKKRMNELVKVEEPFNVKTHYIDNLKDSVNYTSESKISLNRNYKFDEYEKTLPGVIFSKAEESVHKKDSENYSPKNVNRFVLDKTTDTFYIDRCLRISDLKHGNLKGELKKRIGRKYKNTVFQIKNTDLICYNQNPALITGKIKPNLEKHEILSPVNENKFLTVNYIVNFYTAKIYLVRNLGHNALLYNLRMLCMKSEDDIIEITGKQITNVVETNNSYRVYIKGKKEKEVFYCVPILEFAIEVGDAFYFYRPESVGLFIRWLFVISYRQGKLV